MDPYNPLVNFIYRATEPLLNKIRRYMPKTGAFDFSPLVVFAFIFVFQIVVFDTAIHYLESTAMMIRLKG